MLIKFFWRWHWDKDVEIITMWPPLTLWRGGLVIAEQWWKSWLSTGFPWHCPSREGKEHLFIPGGGEVQAFCVVFTDTAQEWASIAWWGWKAWPPTQPSLSPSLWRTCGSCDSLVGLKSWLSTLPLGLGRAAVFSMWCLTGVEGLLAESFLSSWLLSWRDRLFLGIFVWAYWYFQAVGSPVPSLGCMRQQITHCIVP